MLSKFRKQYTLKELWIATTFLAVYFASIPTFVKGKNASSLVLLIVSAFAGTLLARSFFSKSAPALTVGGALGCALGFATPSFFLFFVSRKQPSLWGGYGVTLDFIAWLSGILVALMVGAVVGIASAAIAKIVERLCG